MKKGTLFRMNVTIIMIVLISGCSAKKEAKEEVVKEAEQIVEVISNQAESIYRDYDMEYTFEYTLSAYEPEEGAYLGAYILSNRRIDYDIRQFERLTGKEHLIYTYNMKLGDPFPLSWLLTCVAQSKLPLLTINAPNAHHPFDLQLLNQLAEELKIMQVPMLIQFYPNPNREEYNEEKYIAFYQSAYTVLKESNPRAALVWSVSNRSLDTAEQYFPTEEYTDWVGINIYQAIAEDEQSYERNALADIEFFYKQYKDRKPIMLSQVAVSHYSSRNHRYYIPKAAEEISSIYSAVEKEYSRIKAIVYMDFNNVELSRASIRDNFSITDNETILATYKQVVSPESYLSRLAESKENQTATQMRRSDFRVRRVGETFFIPLESLRQDLKWEESSYEEEIDLQGIRYLSLELLKQKGVLDYVVTEDTVKIKYSNFT